MYHQVCLKYKNFTLRSQSVFMRFDLISEQTGIISIYINWMGFVTQTESAYCAVRTEYVSEIQVNFDMKGLDAGVCFL